MKPEIKELLRELTSVGRIKIELKVLKQADEALVDYDILTLKNKLLHWQKKVIRGFAFYEFQLEYYETTELLLPNYKLFFDNCPELIEVYELKGNRIYFNSSLTSQEKQEILEYIDENYKITRHIRSSK
jgi:hypothetical protein